jgi:hypothetical protein
MLISVTPAFAQAELEYRRQRVQDAFATRRGRRPLRGRLVGLFRPRRRAGSEVGMAAPRPPRAAPHHLASRSS